MRNYQSAALYVARFLGAFAIAQHLTRKRLRILCYHGFSAGDEHEVAPHVFMRRETFERRMRILKRRRLPVISLDDALRKLKAGEINSAETVITFDDGWASNLSVGAPILNRFGYPACVYVTTEHLTAGTEVFNVVLFYMLCRSRMRTFTLTDLHPDINGTYEIGNDPEELRSRLSRAAEGAFPLLSHRQQLLRPIARALDMNLDEILAGGRFQLLRGREIQELRRRGLDIQLHTHTHHLPEESFEEMSDEIEKNRRALSEIVGGVASHFCYPSGRYCPQHLVWLARLGIASATTCETGLNDQRTDLLQLKRYLDSDWVGDIVFEAEVCGLRHLARALRPMASRGAAVPGE